MNQPHPNHSAAPAEDPPGQHSSGSVPPEAEGGYEKSADRDAKSNQAPGRHDRETELKIARQMPDRK
jgi:hypothetical protein